MRWSSELLHNMNHFTSIHPILERVVTDICPATCQKQSQKNHAQSRRRSSRYVSVFEYSFGHHLCKVLDRTLSINSERQSATPNFSEEAGRSCVNAAVLKLRVDNQGAGIIIPTLLGGQLFGGKCVSSWSIRASSSGSKSMRFALT